MGNTLIKAQKQVSCNIDDEKNVGYLFIVFIIGKIVTFCSQISFILCSKETVSVHSNNNIAHTHFSEFALLRHFYSKYISHTKVCRGFT